mmetsp:Transcript_62068/g.93702  ORF Transcript_62068/g.93702 Transcript_62068/m.93702 type:complete len:136 (-) Transcript_62068:434-841(-)
MVARANKRTPKQHTWTVAHLASQEPEAFQYIHDDWDDSTLASTPSIKLNLSSTRNSTTILRRDGEPSEIIISVDRRLSDSRTRKRARRLWRALRLIIFFLFRKRSKETTKESPSDDESVAQPELELDLGQNGVMV